MKIDILLEEERIEFHLGTQDEDLTLKEIKAKLSAASPQKCGHFKCKFIKE